MPKTKALPPNWCDAAPNQDPEEFELDSEDARRLAVLLNIDDPTQFKRFCEDIEELGYEYNEARQVYEEGPTQGTRNKELQAIIKTLSKLGIQIEGASFATRDEFANAFRHTPYQHSEKALQECGVRQLEEFERRIEHALNGLTPHLDRLRKASRGPAPWNPTDATLPRIIEIYEAFAKKRFTHSSLKDGEYCGKPSSHGGTFALEVLKLIDPENTRDNKVVSAIEKHLKAKRHKSK